MDAHIPGPLRVIVRPDGNEAVILTAEMIPARLILQQQKVAQKPRQCFRFADSSTLHTRRKRPDYSLPPSVLAAMTSGSSDPGFNLGRGQ